MEFVYNVYLKRKEDNDYNLTGDKIKVNIPLKIGRMTTERQYKFIAKIDKIEHGLENPNVYLTVN